MRRRDLLLGVGTTLAGAASPLRLRAQQTKVPTVAVLLGGNLPEFTLRAFQEALRDLGYREGRNIHVELRSGEGDPRKLSEVAAALVREKVDIIVTWNTNAILAAKQATHEIPIVMMAAGDPVGMGIVPSYAHPGGNITGTTSLFPQMAAKHVELLKEMMPNLRRVAALGNASDMAFARTFIEHVERAGRIQKVEIAPIIVTPGPELDAAFPAMVHNKIEAVIVQGSLVSKHVADLALANRLPAVAPNQAFVRMGALMAYNGTPQDNIRGAAVFVDKILKGAKPADLPIQQPTRFNFLINLKTAKAIGVTIPPSLLARADEVIE
jgi:putative ABC transport system substrate-binding protein